MRKTILAAIAVTLIGTAAAVLPMATSNAAAACAPAWSSSAVHVKGITMPPASCRSTDGRFPLLGTGKLSV